MSESSSSSTENSEGDWCFVAKQTTSVIDNKEVKEEDKKEETVESTIEDKNIEDSSIPSAPSTVNMIEATTEKKVDGLLETSETHSDSSSDVDVIEEYDNLNTLENIDGSMEHLILQGPLKLNIHSDYLPQTENTPQNFKTLAINCTPEMIDKEIQLSPSEKQNVDIIPEELQNAPENEKSSDMETSSSLSVATLTSLEVKDTTHVALRFYEKYINREYLTSLIGQLRVKLQRTEALILIGLLLSVTFCFMMTMYGVFLVTVDTSVSDQKSDILGMNLMHIHNSLVRCYGEQQIEALKNNDAELLSSIHCMHNYEHYTKVFKAYLNKELTTFLQNPNDVGFKSFVENHPEINLSMIIRQLQYLELLPMTKEDMPQEDLSELFDSEISFEVFREMQDIIENLTLTNQELQNQIAVLNKKTKNENSDDFIIAKDTKDTESDESFINDIIIKELQLKIKLLYVENEKLQREVIELRNLQKSQAYCYNNGNSEEILDEEPYKKYMKQDKSEEKIKPYLDGLVSTLSNQILNLHTSLANELKEVKRYNELIRNLTMEIRNKSSSHTENDSYSWQQLRENVENIVSEAHQDLKEKISAFQTLNLTDAFNNVVEDNKKNAEYMLNVINQYVGIVKEKTQEFLENPIPQIDKDTPVKGFWNVMNNLQDQWHYVKKTVKKIAKKFHARKDIDFESNAETSHYEPEGPSGDWYFKRSRKGIYNAYDNKHVKSDWLFKRAAQRERYHKRNSGRF